MIRGFSVILMVMSALLSVGCGFVSDNKDFTIKSTITATYDGKPVEGSAVLFQRLINGASKNTRGEAVVLELDNGKQAYLLLVDRNFHNIYYVAINTTFGPEKRDLSKAAPKGMAEKVIATPVGSRAIYDYKHWANRAGSRYWGHPLLVAFKDETDPSSVFLVETEKPTTLFGKRFVFGEWSIERVRNDDPLTKQIEMFLPWVNRKHIFWKDKAFDYLETPHREQLLRDAELKNRLSRRHFSSIDRSLR